MALSLATMKDNRVNCWEPQTRNGVGNQQPSLKRKAIAPGLRKVQRLGGEETITRPRVPDYPRGRRYSLSLGEQPQEANHKQVCDNKTLDVYVSDFGAISIVPSRFSRARDAYLIDKELVTLATLRPMQSQELAKTGDATKYMLLVEYGLQVNNEKGLGAVYDLSTS